MKYLVEFDYHVNIQTVESQVYEVEADTKSIAIEKAKWQFLKEFGLSWGYHMLEKARIDTLKYSDFQEFLEEERKKINNEG